MSAEASISGALQPPAWLSKAEKRQFLAIVEGAKERERQLSVMDLDAIADYCAARSRIAELRKMLAALIREKSPLNVDKARMLALGRQIDATTALSRRLAGKLGL